MGQVLPFAPRSQPASPEDMDVDEVIAFNLLTAIDGAIRDLREIALAAGSPTVRRHADECRRRLQSAFDAAVQGA
jgi:hypothetical protein